MFTMEPVKIQITDVLDLHIFRPDEIDDLLLNYLDECVAKGLLSVRIIHGKGKGILKRKVCGILEKHSKVKSFKDASMESGGWGATIAELYNNKGENY